MNLDHVEEAIPPRRIVLRGALVFGFGLWVPNVLTGCDRKSEPPGTNAPAASPDPQAPESGADGSAAPAATQKVSQASVQYQQEPNGDQKCDGCLHFIPESSTCKLVEGQISPNGWCTLWVKKA